MELGDKLPRDAKEGYGITSRLFDDVLDAIETGNAQAVEELLHDLHSADIADLIEQLDSRDRRALVEMWPEGFDGEVLSELGEKVRGKVISQLPPEELAEAVRELESDDVVDLVEYLGSEQQEAVLDALPASERVAVEQALTYPDESAGRLMQFEVARVPEHWTVGEAIDYMRSESTILPEQFYHLVLVDPRMRPVAQVTLGRVLSSPRNRLLFDLSEETFVTFRVTQDEGDVARAFNQYHLISAPVVDQNERLVGVITIDDAMVVLDEEHEEDMLRLAGVGEGTVSDNVFQTVKQRFPWLLVNLVTVNISAILIGLFSSTIATVVALAALMPVVASMGGSAGTQSLTVAVRALATRDLTSSNAWRVVWREVGVGLINGSIFAVLMGAVGLWGYGSGPLGIVLGMAMVINLVIAALAGVVVPMLLNRFRLDPALASGTFVTTITDLVGFFAFLGLATVVLL